jgi:hypothetical protein
MSKTKIWFFAALALAVIAYLGYRDVRAEMVAERSTKVTPADEAAVKSIKVDEGLVVHNGDTWAMCEPTSPEGSSGFKVLWPTKNCKSEDNPVLEGGPRHMTHVKSTDGVTMYMLIWYDRPEGASKDPYGDVLLPSQDGSQSGLKGATVIATRQFKIGDMPCIDYTLKANSRILSRDRSCLFQGKRLFGIASFYPKVDADKDYITKYFESITKI